MPHDEEQMHLTMIAQHLFETCSDVARLNGSQAMTALSAALAICVAHTNEGFTDEKWAEITAVVKDYAQQVHRDVVAQGGRMH